MKKYLMIIAAFTIGMVTSSCDNDSKFGWGDYRCTVALVDDGEGKPLEGYLVRLQPTDDEGQPDGDSLEQTTDQNGEAVFTNLPEGNYSISAIYNEDEVYATAAKSFGRAYNYMIVEVDTTPIRYVYEVKLVTSGESKPIIGRRVEIETPDGTVTASTDAQGVASLEGITKGDYTLKIVNAQGTDYVSVSSVYVGPGHLSTTESVNTVGYIELDRTRNNLSYMGRNIDGSAGTINLECNVDWHIEKPADYDWLTITPMSGQSGASVITFTVNNTSTGIMDAEFVIRSTGDPEGVDIVYIPYRVDVYPYYFVNDEFDWLKELHATNADYFNNGATGMGSWIGDTSYRGWQKYALGYSTAMYAGVGFFKFGNGVAGEGDGGRSPSGLISPALGDASYMEAPLPADEKTDIRVEVTTHVLLEYSSGVLRKSTGLTGLFIEGDGTFVEGSFSGHVTTKGVEFSADRKTAYCYTPDSDHYSIKQYIEFVVAGASNETKIAIGSGKKSPDDARMNCSLLFAGFRVFYAGDK